MIEIEKIVRVNQIGYACDRTFCFVPSQTHIQIYEYVSAEQATHFVRPITSPDYIKKNFPLAFLKPYGSFKRNNNHFDYIIEVEFSDKGSLRELNTKYNSLFAHEHSVREREIIYNLRCNEFPLYIHKYH